MQPGIGERKTGGKNPWLSLWLSAVKQAAGTAQGYWMNGMRRQQVATKKALAEAMIAL